MNHIRPGEWPPCFRQFVRKSWKYTFYKNNALFLIFVFLFVKILLFLNFVENTAISGLFREMGISFAVRPLVGCRKIPGRRPNMRVSPPLRWSAFPVHNWGECGLVCVPGSYSFLCRINISKCRNAVNWHSQLRAEISHIFWGHQNWLPPVF